MVFVTSDSSSHIISVPFPNRFDRSKFTDNGMARILQGLVMNCRLESLR